MSWYYVENGEQRGPVEQAQLEDLFGRGTIGPGTLVWQEGMPNWQAYSTLAGVAPALVAATEVQPQNAALCSRCGQAFTPDQLVQIAGSTVCARCKPLALQSLQEGVAVADNNAEHIRNTYLKHEASVKSIGLLYFLGGAFLALGGLGTALGGARGIAAALMMVVLSALLIGTAVGLRRLRPWSRIASAVLAGIGLLGFPFGTIINGYILYLLLSKKGGVVFSESYQRVIAATPHIKYRTSIVIWILLVLILVLLGMGVMVAFFG